MEDRIRELEGEISRAETVITQCETACRISSAADESQRHSQELDRQKAAHAGFLKEWEDLSQSLQEAGLMETHRRNRTAPSVISENYLLLCDSQIGQRDTNQPEAQNPRPPVRGAARACPELGEGDAPSAGLRKVACSSHPRTSTA